jgi:threonine dehydrogenase-like Zn-dependent dehydrogenase
MLQGSYANEGAPIPYRQFFTKEIRLLVPRNQVKVDRLAVLAMMKEGKLPAEKLLSTLQPPANAQAVYTAIKDKTEPWMTAAFQWDQ